jgi:hypothetical protein
MVIVKADKDSESGKLPDEQLLAAMGRYNEELVNAGVMLAGEGLHPSASGARVRFDGSKRTVSQGPFGDTEQLVAGYWVWKVESRDEAIAWLERAPFQGGEVELRQVFEVEDFAASDPTGEITRKEQELRQIVEARLS